MITKITMKNVASYREQATLNTDKRINLIYGLNGTGKSTLSGFFYDLKNPRYSSCSIEGLDNEEVLVYNQHFINDYFYESEEIRGIFTLSKVNKEAEQEILKAEKVITEAEKNIKSENDQLTNITEHIQNKKQEVQDLLWNIKTENAGSNNPLDFCLDRLKKRELLFEYIIGMSKPFEAPTETIQQLKTEADSSIGAGARIYNQLPQIKFSGLIIETNIIFQKSIVGNDNSTVSDLISHLNNSDWVQDGLKYVSIPNGTPTLCPFCQNSTITDDLYNEINAFFDTTYKTNMNTLVEFETKYSEAINNLPQKNIYEDNPYISEEKAIFKDKYDAVYDCLKTNLGGIQDKIRTPSNVILLKNSAPVIDSFNEFIDIINQRIKEHNEKIAHEDCTKEKIKDNFWKVYRWQYDQTISAYCSEKSKIDNEKSEISEKIKTYNRIINTQNETIKLQRAKTVNIDEAIGNINTALKDLGIDGFWIQKHEANFYRIERTSSCENVFKSLSEGEKMIISFLYFRELCKGEKSISSKLKDKIVMIDDPISSLSNVYVFNIGRIIRKDFYNDPHIKQIFILSHSLYFFYEMAYPNINKKKEDQKLFRITKGNNTSTICEMKYDEIQNDYQSYWSIVNDETQRPALIANCMRNIIEYFFSFTENKKLNEVFSFKELQSNRFQAFNRYINRESHSDGQNIFDYKDFNYKDFKEAFRLVFYKSGYEEHYKKMCSIC